MEKLADSDIENMDVYQILSLILELPNGNSYSDDVYEAQFARDIKTAEGFPAFLTIRDRARRRAEQLIAQNK